jgi:hypothetical protein
MNNKNIVSKGRTTSKKSFRIILFNNKKLNIFKIFKYQRFRQITDSMKRIINLHRDSPKTMTILST